MTIKAIETKKENQFYPTPRGLLEKILKDVEWKQVHTILEPSAGKGDIIDYLKAIEENGYYKTFRHERYKADLNFDIDAIEFEENLRHILKGKNYRIVCDDFLQFHSFKQYDLIIMNPPFHAAEKHLLKAIELQQRYGGNIICILNAETLITPFTQHRKKLSEMLEKYSADVQFYKDEFKCSEHPTDVEIAVVKIAIPKQKSDSSIFEGLRSFEKIAESTMDNPGTLAVSDYVEAIIQQYDFEVESCIRLVEEYKNLQSYILESFTKERYANSILRLVLDGEDSLSVNKLVEKIRYKYWESLFKHPKFTQGMTSKQIGENLHQIKELAKYDFSFFNIKTLQIEMVKKRIHGIEECIVELFDELSHEYSWLPETGRNVHYYNGWSTNKAHMINNKVIIPMSDLFSQIFKKFRYSYTVQAKLQDIEKVFDYLNGTPGRKSSLVQIMRLAENEQITKKIETQYFYLDFFKKGTCHITFKDSELLKRFNIAGGRYKAWLPPCYGKKPYEELTPEEKKVIDGFEGKKSYQEVYQNSKKYLFQEDIPSLFLLG